MITHSYIVTCLESYAVAQKQVQWLARILPRNWELIFVDDGSVPPIVLPEQQPVNTRLIQTLDIRPWTQDIARNKAAALAQGQYLLMTDIDHVFTAKALAYIERFEGNMGRFHRRAGIFVEGTPRPLSVYVKPVPPNVYLIRRDVFMDLGGYDESLCTGRYTGTDAFFIRKYEAKYGRILLVGSGVFVIPEPYEKFHQLSRI